MAKSRRSQRKTANRLPLLLGIGGALLVLILAGVLLSGGPERAVSAYPAEISVADAAAKRTEGAFMLDVRQPEEWNEFHMPGAILIPLGELEARLAELPRDQEIVVVCRSGNRSATGRDILRDAGFTEVTSMAGGMNEWRAEGFETVTGP